MERRPILANTPCEGFAWVEIVYTSVGSGLALAGQYSTISGGTYVSSASFASSAGNTANSALGVAVNTIYAGPTRGNFFQIAVSALTSGTFAGTVAFRTYAPPLAQVSTSQAGTWTVGSNSATGAADPANAFYVAGDNASGNLVGLHLDSNGHVIGTGGSVGSGDAVSYVFPYGTTNFPLVYNGTNFDRQRSATSAAGTTGTGLLGAGILGYDGTDWQYAQINAHALLAQAVQTDTIGSTTAMTITLASLATSSAGVGRQSTLITGNTARSALIGVKLTTGTTPTINTLAYVYLIRGNGTLTDDAAGASDAGLTVVNAPLLGTLLCSSASTGTVLEGLFDTKFLGSLGGTWGIAIVNSTGASLNSTAANQVVDYQLLT